MWDESGIDHAGVQVFKTFYSLEHPNKNSAIFSKASLKDSYADV